MAHKKSDKINFEYCLNFDYRNNSDNCQCGDDYCRCSTIVDIKIKEVKYNSVFDEYLKFLDIKIKDIENLYVLDRIISKYGGYSVDGYEIGVCGGYYGEEIRGATFNFFDDIIREFNLIKDKTFNEKIEHILILEYGKIIPKLKNCVFNIENITINDIEIPNNQYYESVKEKNLDNRYSKRKLPIAVVHNRGNNYKIVDGYHRLCQIIIDNQNDDNDGIISVIVARHE